MPESRTFFFAKLLVGLPMILRAAFYKKSGNKAQPSWLAANQTLLLFSSYPGIVSNHLDCFK
jgi:hypothetical protein